MKRNCTNCAFCERFKYFPKDKFEMMRCWQEPGVCDHAFVQSMNEAEDYVCDEHRTKEEREKELKESEDERMMGVIRLALTDVPEERFTTEGTSLSEVLAWMEKQKEQKQSITIDQLKSLMLQYLQEAANEKEDSDIEVDTDKWARKILGYDFEQKPLEWSEEDEKMRDYIIHALTNNTHAKEQGPVLYAKEIDWLKSLKDRGNFPKSNTNSPSEWSEEDEAMRDNILRLLSCFVGTSECDSNPSLSTSYPAYQKEMDWLKSLRPQPHWKPSEEQMRALSETIAFAPDTFKPKCTLVTLQDDLKKLMEE